MRRIAFLTATLLPLFALGLCEEPITCDAGHFAARQTASVTCHFYRSMKDSRHHVFVLHYPFDAPKQFSGNDVLKCIHLDHAKPLCEVAEGYEFNSDISNRLTLTIPEVKEGVAGRYVCQVVPPDGGLINGCDLTVNGTVDTNTTTVVTPFGSNTENLPQSENISATIFVVQPVIIGILSFIIVVLVIVIIGIWKLYRRHSTRHESQTKTPMLSDSTITKMAVNAHTQTDKSVGKALYHLQKLQSILELQTADFDDKGLDSGYNTINVQSLC